MCVMSAQTDQRYVFSKTDQTAFPLYFNPDCEAETNEPREAFNNANNHVSSLAKHSLMA